MTFLRCDLWWTLDTFLLTNNGTMTIGSDIYDWYNPADYCLRSDYGSEDDGKPIDPNLYNWTLAVR
jgi:hypothetical protein